MRTTLVKIEHKYELFRGEVLLAEAETTLGCVNRQGQVQVAAGVVACAARKSLDSFFEGFTH